MLIGTQLIGFGGRGGGSNLFAVTPYTGNGSTQSIVTGQNQIAGALDWIKCTNVIHPHLLIDTVRGNTKFLQANSADPESTATFINSFNSNGFTLSSENVVNGNGNGFVAFSWIKNSDNFDIVTYIGNGANRTISHSLTTVPKMIWVKSRRDSDNFIVYHSSLGNTGKLYMDLTQVAGTDATAWNSTTPTSSVFSLGTQSQVNTNSSTYVAYLFAEKAGKSKFGSYTGTGSSGSLLVSGMGFTPKAMLVKRTDSTGDWWLLYKDGTSAKYVVPNKTDQAFTYSTDVNAVFGNGTFTSAGAGANASGGTYIYAAWG